MSLDLAPPRPNTSREIDGPSARECADGVLDRDGLPPLERHACAAIDHAPQLDGEIIGADSGEPIEPRHVVERVAADSNGAQLVPGAWAYEHGSETYREKSLFHGLLPSPKPVQPGNDPRNLLRRTRTRTFNTSRRWVNLCLLPDEHAQLAAEAERRGMKTTTLARRMLLDFLQSLDRPQAP